MYKNTGKKKDKEKATKETQGQARYTIQLCIL